MFEISKFLLPPELCEIDTLVITDIAIKEVNTDIPDMTLDDLNKILFNRLKLGKACDLNQLTVEHLRFAGSDTLSLILKVINSIIRNINYLSSSELNTSIASIIHKGKGKPVTNHKSYRQVRVAPLLSRIIDEY